MIRTKRLQRNLKFHSRISVRTYKLVMIQLNNIPLRLRNHTCHTHQFTRLIRNQNRNRKDSVPLDQTMLHNRRHRDHIHISTTQDRNNLLPLHIQMTKRSHSQKTRILHDHLMILNHIQESHDQLIILNRDDIIQILLDIRENLLTRCLNSSTICDRIYMRKRHNLPLLQRSLHTCSPGRFHTDHLNMRIQKLSQCRNTSSKSAPTDRNQNIIH